MTEATVEIVADTPPADPTPNPAPIVNADPAPPPTSSDQAPPADPVTKAAWPDDWREQLAGKDETFLKQLMRYSSPTTFAKGWKEREDIIRSGKVKPEKPADASDEKAMTEWRKANGIPENAEGYKLPDDVLKVLTDEDKPILANFTEFAHKKGLPPESVSAAAEWYIESQTAAAEQRKAQDDQDAEKCSDALYDDWSRAEFKGNRVLAARFLDKTPLGQEGWGMMRKTDGTLLANDPEFMKWAADQGRSTFGDAAFANSDAETKHTNRKAEIEKIRATDFDRYEREYSKEYREILELEAKRVKK